VDKFSYVVLKKAVLKVLAKVSNMIKKEI